MINLAEAIVKATDSRPTDLEIGCKSVGEMKVALERMFAVMETRYGLPKNTLQIEAANERSFSVRYAAGDRKWRFRLWAGGHGSDSSKTCYDVMHVDEKGEILNGGGTFKSVPLTYAPQYLFSDVLRMMQSYFTEGHKDLFKRVQRDAFAGSQQGLNPI